MRKFGEGLNLIAVIARKVFDEKLIGAYATIFFGAMSAVVVLIGLFDPIDAIWKRIIVAIPLLVAMGAIILELGIITRSLFTQSPKSDK